MKYTVPRYLKIALDISERIGSGEIVEGAKLKGRSVLSTEYSVSPETIRRAMYLLANKDVVKISNGKETIVLSKEKAVDFQKSFEDDNIINNLRYNLSKACQKKIELDYEINSLTEQIVDMYKYKRSSIIKPVEVQISKDSHMIGKSIGELEIWHKTGATIIGVRRGQSTIVSPGPYFDFLENDAIIFVGDNSVIERFNAFTNGININ